MSLEDRFWEKVVIQDGCWGWSGATVNGGYGTLTIGERGAGHIRAHRLSYILHKGEIPAGQYVLHRCDNPECTNPDHLELGTPADNMRHVSERKRNPLAHKTHCVNGHEYTPENTILRGTTRQCRACKNAQSKRRYRAKRGKKFGVIERKAKTHCQHGHKLTPENTYQNPNGSNECRKCRAERVLRHRAQKRSQT